MSVVKFGWCCLLAVSLFGGLLPAARAEESAALASFVTEHEGVFGENSVTYTARAEETLLTNSQGVPAATIFSFSYVENTPKSDKPVLFVYNGGPGSSSVWLHMGMLGPRRIVFPDPVHPPTVAPFEIGDNPRSLLDVADLVFIDPVGTGFSRLRGEEMAGDFYGVEEDAKAVADFIKAWLTRHARWNSPRFLMGESYGAIRSAALANTLTGGPASTGKLDAISLNGILLLGPSFESGGASGADNDMACVTSLPTYAATAWYHGKINKESVSLKAAVAAAESFAADDYLRALYAGSNLTEQERRRLAEKLSSLTGLSPETWQKRNLRVDPVQFARLLLKDRGLQLGAYDSRYTLPLAGSAGDPVADDAAMGQYTPGFVAALNATMSNDLKIKTGLPYNAIAFREINARWDWGVGPGLPAPRHNYAEDIATAMRRNPSLRLFVGSGDYDMVTTMGATAYSLRHAGLPMERVTQRVYESGHMPYLGEESAEKLSQDVRAFLRSY